jgi:heme-degrading monooxygenase HmoA
MGADWRWDVIARVWKGAVRRDDGDAYAEYMRDTGMEGYTTTPGNRLALMLRRDVGDKTEFVMFSLWESFESIRAFAGGHPEKAVFYPEDDRYLIERDWTVAHFDVHTAAGIPL